MKKYVPVLKIDPSKLNSKFKGYSISRFNLNFSLINFSPGPSTINPVIIENVVNELSCKKNKFTYGNTPLEMSHRSPEFNLIINKVNNKIRKFMKIPNNFSIIWTQGGGHGQFSAIPMNMNRIFNNVVGCYAVTGTWSNKAFNESKKFINSINITEKFYEDLDNPLEYNNMPLKLNIPNNADYLYICSNETVNGIEFRNNGINYPNKKILGKTKLVVDMSSDFLMKKVNWNNIDVAFACSSKNMGTAGINILVIKNNLLKKIDINKKIPCTLDWSEYYNTNSLYNTPAVFNFYLLDKIMDNYIFKMKTIENIEKYNSVKAEILYNFLDNNFLFKPCVNNINMRSNINIPFILGNGSLKLRNMFLDYCYKHNIVGLRTNTPFCYKFIAINEPLRISLYNSITIEDVENMIKVMKAFQNLFCK